jgi:hypothetical protein
MEIGDILFEKPILPYSANKNICNAKIYNVILIFAQKSSHFNELNPLWILIVLCILPSPFDTANKPNSKDRPRGMHRE